MPASNNHTCVSRHNPEDQTQIKIGSHVLGGQDFTVIAGPCAVESKEQMTLTALAVKKAGANLLRGGAYKPRSSPYSFQGLQEEGLRLLKEAGQVAGLPTVSEAISVETFDLVEAYVDVIQIGTRNMQNYPLLKRAGQSSKPILLKRGMSATIEEFLLAAEYIVSTGNSQVILCERGIRTFETYTRNTLDLSAVLALKKLSHLPVIVDPSHGTGHRDMVTPMARATYVTGAHGLMVEVHYKPDTALCDGHQSLDPGDFEHLMKKINQLKEIDE